MEGQRQQFTWYDEMWFGRGGYVDSKGFYHLLPDAVVAAMAAPPYVDLDALEREAQQEPDWARYYLNRITDEVSEDRHRKRHPRGGTGGRPVQHAEEGRTGEADHRPASPPRRPGRF